MTHTKRKATKKKAKRKVKKAELEMKVLVKKDTIKQQLDRITRVFPIRDLSTGMMYKTKSSLLVKRKKIILWGLFVSDGNTFLLRPHTFKTKKTGKNAVQWEAWLAEHYGTILRDSILPAMANRTGKLWRLYRIVGWHR